MIPNQYQRPDISTTGDVTLVRKPDVAYVSLYICADGILLEDAVREASSKAEQVLGALRDAYGSEIKDIHIKDVYAGEGKPAIGLGMPRDKSNPPRPEVVKGLLVVLPAKPDLAVKVVDSACRMGCLISNPVGTPGFGGPQSVILYGLAEPAEAEQEATALAIADARSEASRTAKMLEKRLGAAVKQVSVLAFHSPEDFGRRMKTRLLGRESYLSVSPEQVEIPAKVSLTFELFD